MGIFTKIKCWFIDCNKFKDIKNEVEKILKETSKMKEEMEKEIEKVQETLDNKVADHIKKVKRHWYNNGKEQKLISTDIEIAEGWIRGKLSKRR